MGERRGRIVAASTIAVLLAILAYYLFLIASQGERDVGRVAFVVVLFLAVVACIVGTLTLDSPSARGLAGAGAAGFLLSFSVLAVFSIGYLLLVGAVLAIVWLVRTHAERRGSNPLPRIAAFVVGALIPWSLLLLG